MPTTHAWMKIRERAGRDRGNQQLTGICIGGYMTSLFAHNGLTGSALDFVEKQGILWSSRQEFDELLVYLGLRPLPDL